MHHDRNHSVKPAASSTQPQTKPQIYILVRQEYPYAFWNPEQATPHTYSTLDEARAALSEYVVMNYVRYHPLQPAIGLGGYEGGFARCLDMQADKIVGRVWIERIS